MLIGVVVTRVTALLRTTLGPSHLGVAAAALVQSPILTMSALVLCRPSGRPGVNEPRSPQAGHRSDHGHRLVRAAVLLPAATMRAAAMETLETLCPLVRLIARLQPLSSFVVRPRSSGEPTRGLADRLDGWTTG